MLKQVQMSTHTSRRTESSWEDDCSIRGDSFVHIKLGKCCAGVEWPLNYNTLLRTGDMAKSTEKYGFGQNVARNGDFVYEVSRWLTD